MVRDFILIAMIILPYAGGLIAACLPTRSRNLAAALAIAIAAGGSICAAILYPVGLPPGKGDVRATRHQPRLLHACSFWGFTVFGAGRPASQPANPSKHGSTGSPPSA